MKNLKVSVTAKIGSLSRSKEVAYEEPETWQEAIEMDGSEKAAFKIYLNERKTNFQDKERKEMVKALTQEIEAKMKELGISF